MKLTAFALTLIISGSAFGVCSKNVICAKDYIIDQTNSTGKVLEVFKNGRASVKYDRWGIRTASVTDLNKAVLCDHGICMKDRVMLGGYATGTAMAIYSNTKAFVKWDKYGWQLVRTTQLSKAVKN